MEVTYFLKQFSLFGSLNTDVIRSYFGSAEKRSFEEGSVIIDYNDDVENLYIILGGRVSVYVKDSDGNEYIVDKLKAGDTFGEMTLLSNDTQPLMIKAADSVDVVMLTKERFDELLKSYPVLNNKFYQILTRRLHHMYSKKEEKVEEAVIKTERISNGILKRQEKELLFLDKVHHIIASEQPFKLKLTEITKGISTFYDTELCLLYLYEKDNRYVKLYAANDYKSVYASSYRVSQNDEIIRWIKEYKAPLLVDYEQDFKSFSKSKFLAVPDFKDLLFIPLIEDEEFVGLLALLSKKKTEYSDEDKRFLEIISGNFIGIIRKEQFDYETHLRTVELDTLKNIAEAAHKKPSLKELLQYILESTASAMNAKRCSLKLHDPLSDTITIRASHGFDDEEYEIVNKGMVRHLRETVLDIGEYVIINDTSKIKRFSDDAKKIAGSLISVPFKLHDKVIGMITVYDKKEDSLIDIFDQNDLRLLTAIATHTSIMVENARLYDELAYSQAGAKVQLKVATEILGESFKAKLVNDKIKKFSVNADPVLIIGEMGIGKNFAARCIHFSSNRMAYHFIVEDCRNFEDKVHGADLFGKRPKTAEEEDIRGLLQQAHDGTITLRHIEALSKEAQEKLYDYLITKKFKRINGTREHSPDVKVIFQCNMDISKLVDSGQFNAGLYELISRQTIKLPPLRERKKDLPLIIKNFLEVINDKLQKNVTNISESALGMLMSYDWPGNVMELYNVLERAVLVASQDTILSEQIFLGIPRAEGEKTYNILRFNWVKRLFQSRLYPGVFQGISVALFITIIYFAFFSSTKGEKNIAVILSWIIGWPLLFISYILFGRIWCSICPFSAIAKFTQKFINLGRKMSDRLKKRSNVIAVTFCLAIIWFEEVTNIYTSPYITGSLILFIFALAMLTSMIYERMVWCRYLCPWGILNGLFAMTSFMELRSNRHVCLTQCKTNVCYEGSDAVSGCPMYEHPYGMESNKNCTLCANCIKNCPNNSIQLNIRLVAKELWVKVHPFISDSILGISLAFIFVLKKLLELGNVEDFVFFGYDRYSLKGSIIYTSLYILTILLAIGVLQLINYSQPKLEDKYKSHVRENIGYAFIPLALCGFLTHYLEPLLMKSRALVHAVKYLLFGTPFPEVVMPILRHETITNIQVVLILIGGIASGISAYKIISHRMKLKDQKVSAYKIAPIWVIAALTIAYLVLI